MGCGRNTACPANSLKPRSNAFVAWRFVVSRTSSKGKKTYRHGKYSIHPWHLTWNKFYRCSHNGQPYMNHTRPALNHYYEVDITPFWISKQRPGRRPLLRGLRWRPWMERRIYLALTTSLPDHLLDQARGGDREYILQCYNWCWWAGRDSYIWALLVTPRGLQAFWSGFASERDFFSFCGGLCRGNCDGRWMSKY